ncbi:hypothetical protein ACFW40_11385 [Streptomyces sp. NPDC058807]|uniref:hypothetical protein n=1 Tax=unclassified Streptomyces TaxID=2593676 RepID=UPI00369F80ED
MSQFIDVPGLVSSLVGAGVLAGVTATWQRMRVRESGESKNSISVGGARTLRRYTLLRTAGAHGSPEQYETTWPTGTVITHRLDGGHPQRFELTDAPFGDGTYAAEPLDYL